MTTSPKDAVATERADLNGGEGVVVGVDRARGRDATFTITIATVLRCASLATLERRAKFGGRKGRCAHRRLLAARKRPWAFREKYLLVAVLSSGSVSPAWAAWEEVVRAADKGVETVLLGQSSLGSHQAIAMSHALEARRT